jgi:transcriptional regulator with XRE-family HTH domain
MVEDDFSEENDAVKSQIRLLATKLCEERKKQSISQIDLSFKAGLSQNMVNWVETGRISPTVSTVFKICNALNISPAILFGVTPDERSAARETVLELVAKYM